MPAAGLWDKPARHDVRAATTVGRSLNQPLVRRAVDISLHIRAPECAGLSACRYVMITNIITSRALISRRALLCALGAAPVAISSPAPAHASAPDDGPPTLRRTREGRSLSRFRYHNAESFFLGVERDARLRLYETGIVLQLGLSAHLLDVGYDDRWCAHHIGVHVARSFSHANLTGLDFRSNDMELLTALLSPYSEWRDADVSAVTPDFPFTPDEVRSLTRALLDHVREVAGHPRPRGRSRLSAMGHMPRSRTEPA